MCLGSMPTIATPNKFKHRLDVTMKCPRHTAVAFAYVSTTFYGNKVSLCNLINQKMNHD